MNRKSTSIITGVACVLAVLALGMVSCNATDPPDEPETEQEMPAAPEDQPGGEPETPALPEKDPEKKEEGFMPLDDTARQVVAAHNATGWQLYRALREEGKNLVISPWSIGAAMAMARAGARGETETEMANVLNLDLPREQLNDAQPALTSCLNRFEEVEAIQLNTANGLCLTLEGHMVSDAYKTLLQEKYDAELFQAQDVGPINAWVADKTNGKIEKLLDRLSPLSVCVLLNAVYFKGLWAEQFDAEQTRDAPFHLTAEKSVTVPMMNQRADFVVTKLEGARAIRLPYKDESLALVVILPDEIGGLDAIEEKLTPDVLSQTLDELNTGTAGKVIISLPRFKVESDAGLIEPFQALGMQLAFSSERANFGGVIGREDAQGIVWISQIKHKAMIEVNEEGSEAAAATAVEMRMTGMPVEPERFIADRPFLFLLTDRVTGAVLFLGRVVNPAV